MNIDMKEKLGTFARNHSITGSLQFPDVSVDSESIKTIMINEVVPHDPGDDFYGDNNPPDYLTTTLPLFAKAGFEAASVGDITKAGIYITNAVKTPKSDTTISKEMIEISNPLLEYEIGLFPNLMVIMLMGDVAKKALNMITKRKTGKNIVPSISTYKLRTGEIYYENIRVFPSYIMTGGNILIEKSKVEMAAEDIHKMLTIIK